MDAARGVGVGLLVGTLGCYSGVDPGDPEAATEGAADATGTSASSVASDPGSDTAASGPGSASGTSTTSAGETDSAADADDDDGEDSASAGTTDDDAGDADSDSGVDPPPEGCSAAGVEIVDIINAVRAEHGLAAVPLSPSMCVVAATHNQDLAAHAPHAPAECNLHSWSDQGPWTGCCYTPDHAQAQCMWDKPGELTDYPGNGYEVSAAGGGLTPQSAVDLWMGSPGHRAVLLSEGAWADPPWMALGADLQDGFAAAWFGRQADPDG
jgi:uncharacterized protein YkwD